MYLENVLQNADKEVLFLFKIDSKKTKVLIDQYTQALAENPKLPTIIYNKLELNKVHHVNYLFRLSKKSTILPRECWLNHPRNLSRRKRIL
jgi:hypothetical protein